MNINEKREEIMSGVMGALTEAHIHPLDPDKKRKGDIVLFNINQFKDPDGTVRSDIYRLGWLYAINRMPYEDLAPLIDEYYENRDQSIFILKRKDLIPAAMAAIAEQSLLRTELVCANGVANYDHDIMTKVNGKNYSMSLKAMVENQYLTVEAMFSGRDDIIMEVYEKIFPTPMTVGKFGSFVSGIKNVVSKAFR